MCFFFSFFFLASSQLIAHSSRVRTPKRHNSESVLYMGDDQSVISTSSSTDMINKIHSSGGERSSRNNHRLFAVSTYTEVPTSPTSSDTQGNKYAIFFIFFFVF